MQPVRVWRQVVWHCTTKRLPHARRQLSSTIVTAAKSRLAQQVEDDHETLRRIQRHGAGHAVSVGTRQTDAMQQMAETKIQEGLNQVRIDLERTAALDAR